MARKKLAEAKPEGQAEGGVTSEPNGTGDGVIDWRTSRRLTHARLVKGFLHVEWMQGRWQPLSCIWPNGHMEEGLRALRDHNLVLRNPFHPVPKILGQEEV